TLLAHGSRAVFGDAAWSLRLPAVVFGVASIEALYLLGTVVTGRREALLAAALMAVSYHHVWFSQNARGYTGLLLFTLLSSWFLLQGLRQGHAILWLGYGVTAAAGMWVHLTMSFVIAGQLFVALGWAQSPATQRRRVLAGFIWAGLLTVLLYLPVLPQLFSGVLGNGHSEASRVAEWKAP